MAPDGSSTDDRSTDDRSTDDRSTDDRSTAVWVVRLRHDGHDAPAPVGPFDSEAAAAGWAIAFVSDLGGWAWQVEPLVTPVALAARWAPRRRHLRLVS
jgi:hypothetical protein